MLNERASPLRVSLTFVGISALRFRLFLPRRFLFIFYLFLSHFPGELHIFLSRFPPV